MRMTTNKRYKNFISHVRTLLVAGVLSCFLLPNGMPTALATESATPTQTTHQTSATGEPTPIFDAQDLLSLADDPTGSYRLMADIDLAGTTWEPVAFAGTLDGQGHAILNATVTSVPTPLHTTYDGNMVSYETTCCGFFESLDGATVKDVDFLGIDVDITTDSPTFVGTICGFLQNSTIDGCSVTGSASLATTGKSFGVGGIVGFGRGSILNSTADVTLVCRDLDAVNKDEQFMGGAYGNGCIDLDSCDITIHGFDSDHGYVHDGGLAGMYITYYGEPDHMGFITNNKVQGTITFFEDNLDRRAYCEPFVGENMNPWNVNTDANTEDFVRDERFAYDVDLLPHTCENPTWTDEHVPSDCTNHGHTLHTCDLCGYSYQTDWEPLEHSVDTWSDASIATPVGTPLEEGQCTSCGSTVYRQAVQDATDNPGGQDANQDAGGFGIHLSVGIILLGALSLAMLVAIILLVVHLRG